MPWDVHSAGRALSIFGEPWLLLPLTGLVAVTLAIRRDRVEAAAWLGAVLSCIASVVAMKVAGYAVATLAGLDRNPFNVSGHAAFTAIVHGGIALEAARFAGRRSGGVRAGALVLAGGCVLVIMSVAWSRVALGAHTMPEAAMGVVVGCGGLWLWRHPRSRRAAGRSGLLPWVAFVAVALFWAGLISQRFPSEQVVQAVGRSLGMAAGSIIAPTERR